MKKILVNVVVLIIALSIPAFAESEFEFFENHYNDYTWKDSRMVAIKDSNFYLPISEYIPFTGWEYEFNDNRLYLGIDSNYYQIDFNEGVLLQEGEIIKVFSEDDYSVNGNYVLLSDNILSFMGFSFYIDDNMVFMNLNQTQPNEKELKAIQRFIDDIEDEMFRDGDVFNIDERLMGYNIEVVKSKYSYIKNGKFDLSNLRFSKKETVKIIFKKENFSINKDVKLTLLKVDGEVNNNHEKDWYSSQKRTGKYSSINCGPAVISMAYKYELGESESVEDIRTNIGHSKGTNLDQIRNYLSKGNIRTSFISDSKDIYIEELNKGNLIIPLIGTKEIYGSQGDLGHFIIVYGYEKVYKQGGKGYNEYFLINDPDSNLKKIEANKLIKASQYYNDMSLTF